MGSRKLQKWYVTLQYIILPRYKSVYALYAPHMNARTKVSVGAHIYINACIYVHAVCVAMTRKGWSGVGHALNVLFLTKLGIYTSSRILFLS